MVELPKAWAPWVPAAHGVELLELQAHILAHVARAQRAYDEAVLSVAAGGQWPSQPAWLRREWGRPQLVGRHRACLPVTVRGRDRRSRWRS